VGALKENDSSNSCLLLRQQGRIVCGGLMIKGRFICRPLTRLFTLFTGDLSHKGRGTSSQYLDFTSPLGGEVHAASAWNFTSPLVGEVGTKCRVRGEVFNILQCPLKLQPPCLKFSSKQPPHPFYRSEN